MIWILLIKRCGGIKKYNFIIFELLFLSSHFPSLLSPLIQVRDIFLELEGNGSDDIQFV